MVCALVDAATPTPVRRLLTYGLISVGASAAGPLAAAADRTQ